MSHRRARKDAKKAAAAAGSSTIVENVSTQMRGIGYGVTKFREMMGPKRAKNYRPQRGAGVTTQHCVGTKPARRAAQKRAKASRKANR
jgi:hypothetical protein